MHSRLKTDRKFSTTALMKKHVKLTQRNQYRPLPEPFDPSVMLLMVSRSSSLFARRVAGLIAFCMIVTPILAQTTKRNAGTQQNLPCEYSRIRNTESTKEVCPTMYSRTPYQRLMESIDRRHHKLVNEMLKYVSINNDFTYIHDWLAIHDLLSNGELFDEYMRELEGEINKFRNQLPANQNNSTLLIQFFTQWAKTQGFTELKILDAYIPLDAFLENILRKKILFVDQASVLEKHGAWPHVLQWYATVKHATRNRQFLQHELLDVYASFADAEIIRDEFNRSAWDFFFDSYYENYSSPDYVTNAMHTDHHFKLQCPLLVAALNENRNESRVRARM